MIPIQIDFHLIKFSIDRIDVSHLFQFELYFLVLLFSKMVLLIQHSFLQNMDPFQLPIPFFTNLVDNFLDLAINTIKCQLKLLIMTIYSSFDCFQLQIQLDVDFFFQIVKLTMDVFEVLIQPIFNIIDFLLLLFLSK